MITLLITIAILFWLIVASLKLYSVSLEWILIKNYITQISFLYNLKKKDNETYFELHQRILEQINPHSYFNKVSFKTFCDSYGVKFKPENPGTLKLYIPRPLNMHKIVQFEDELKNVLPMGITYSFEFDEPELFESLKCRVGRVWRNVVGTWKMFRALRVVVKNRY